MEYPTNILSKLIVRLKIEQVHQEGKPDIVKEIQQEITALESFKKELDEFRTIKEILKK